MEDERPPTFAELRRRYQLLGASPARTVALSSALQAGDDPLHILSYIGALGVCTETLQQLHSGINGLEDEEELFAFRCQEGIAVSIASDDEWILFTE
jgi:hypothetical protein